MMLFVNTTAVSGTNQRICFVLEVPEDNITDVAEKLSKDGFIVGNKIRRKKMTRRGQMTIVGRAEVIVTEAGIKMIDEYTENLVEEDQ